MYNQVPDSSEHRPREVELSGISGESRAPWGLEGSESAGGGAEAARGNEFFKHSQASRYVGLGLLLFFLSAVLISHGRMLFVPQERPPISDKEPSNVWLSKCFPGRYRSADQMRYSYWRPLAANGEGAVVFPLYTTGNLDQPVHPGIKRAVILQHGNLRNGNEYFCSAINVLRDFYAAAQRKLDENAGAGGVEGASSDPSSALNLENYLIIVPQFVTEDDFCWMPDSELMQAIRIEPPSTCGLPLAVYSNEGWKDGHLSLGGGGNSSSAATWGSNRLHSYEIYNRLLDRLLDPQRFPALEDVTLFGFSAGAQTLLRYAAFPRLSGGRNITWGESIPALGARAAEINWGAASARRRRREADVVVGRGRGRGQGPARVLGAAAKGSSASSSHPQDVAPGISGTATAVAGTAVRVIISDPSTFLYLDARRPYTNGSFGFGVPTGVLGQPSSWLPSRWARSEIDGSPWLPIWNESCANFNSFRYGLDRVEGYYKDHHADRPAVRDAIIAALPSADITYLVGSDDTANCHLEGHNGCNDNELATYCQAMLQGANRLDRVLKWKAYLKHFYGREVHRMAFVEGVQHDALALLSSGLGRCVVFGACED